MRAEAEFREVVEAVRVHMAGQPHAVEADWELFQQIAANLNVKMDETATGAARDAQERLHGQVRRALNRLADDGTLVKHSDGHRPEFLTPQAERQRQQRAAEAKAASQARREQKAAEQARADAAAARLTELGIQAFSSSDGDGHPSIAMPTGDALLVSAVLAWAKTRGATISRDWFSTSAGE